MSECIKNEDIRQYELRGAFLEKSPPETYIDISFSDMFTLYLITLSTGILCLLLKIFYSDY